MRKFAWHEDIPVRSRRGLVPHVRWNVCRALTGRTVVSSRNIIADIHVSYIEDSSPVAKTREQGSVFLFQRDLHENSLEGDELC